MSDFLSRIGSVLGAVVGIAIDTRPAQAHNRGEVGR